MPEDWNESNGCWNGKLPADDRGPETVADLKAKEPGAWQRIKDCIGKLAEKLRKVCDGVSPDSREGQMVAGEAGVYCMKKEAMQLVSAGVRFPKQVQSAIASDSIIHHISEKINTSIQNNTKSIQLKKWFGDWQNNVGKVSKVVDETGAPPVMRHGTDASITREEVDRNGGKRSLG